MALLAERTGRGYHVVDYVGDPEAECVVVVMGSGGETVQETVARSLRAAKEPVWRRCGSTGRFRRRRWSSRCPRPCVRSPSSTGRRNRARSASRSSSTPLRR